MLNFNKIILVGRFTRDPEQVQAGQSTITKFTIAVDSGYGEYKKPCFIDCQAWAAMGDNIYQAHRKGDPILIEGELQQDTWETQGGKRSKHLINVRGFTFMQSKKDSPPQEKREVREPELTPEQQMELDEFDENIPF